MPIALDVGTITIQNQDIARFVQNKSIDEIRMLFVNFLSREVHTADQKPQNKWAEFGEKMHGLVREDTAGILKAGSEEFRENFAFRDLDR